MATPKFNSKSPTIRRICMISPSQEMFSVWLSLTKERSERSCRVVQLAVSRLHSSSVGIRSLRMALHLSRPPQLGIRGRNLPWSHRAPPYVPTAPAKLPILDTQRQVRGEPRDLSQHQRTPRGNVAACLGCPHGAGRVSPKIYRP